MSSFGGRFGGLTLPPNAIETSAPESGTRRTGGNLPTPEGPRVGLIAPGVTASNGDFSAAQRAADLAQALSGLAGAVGMAGQVAAQDRAEARRTKAEEEAADALQKATGASSGAEYLPRGINDIANNRIPRQDGETDEQFVERVIATQTANMAEAEAIGFRARVYPQLLDTVIKANEEAAKTARVEISQQAIDLVSTGALSGDRGMIDSGVMLYAGLNRVSKAEAEKEVIIPALMRGAETGQENVVKNLTAVLGPDRHIVDQQLATAKLEGYKARISQQQDEATQELVATALNDYATGNLSFAQLVDRTAALRRSGASERILRPLFSEIDQMRERELRKAEDAKKQARIQQARAGAVSRVDTALANGKWYQLPERIELIDGAGQPVLDDKGQVVTISRDEQLDASMDRQARAIMADQSVPPQQRLTRLNTLLVNTGREWKMLKDMAASAASFSIGVTDDPMNPQGLQQLDSFLSMYEALAPSVRFNHTTDAQRDRFDAIIAQRNQLQPLSDPGMTTPVNQTEIAIRNIEQARSLNIPLTIDDTDRDFQEVYRSLLEPGYDFIPFTPDDVPDTDLLRASLIREYKATRLRTSNKRDALMLAKDNIQKNYRMVGKDLSKVNDPRIPGTVDGKAELLNRIGQSMAKDFLKANPPFARSNGDLTYKDLYLTPVGDGNITDEWQLVYRNDIGIMGMTGRRITVGDIREMIGDLDADRFIALEDAKRRKEADTKDRERAALSSRVAQFRQSNESRLSPDERALRDALGQ